MTCYDGWDLVLGQTLVHAPLIDTVLSKGGGSFHTAEFEPTAFCERVERWLLDRRRLVEINSGAPMARCLFVKVDSESRVTKVLADGSRHATTARSGGGGGKAKEG